MGIRLFACLLHIHLLREAKHFMFLAYMTPTFVYVLQLLCTKFGELKAETARNIKYKEGIKLADGIIAGPNGNSHTCSWPSRACQV